MRTPDPTSVASRVAARIARGAGDRLWTYENFQDLSAPPTAVAAALSRLTRKGTLRRIRRGVYYRPVATAFGESRPDPEAALKVALRRRGAGATPSGLEAWRRLGLTSQVTSEAELVSSGRIRISPVLGQKVRASVRPLGAPSAADERAVLDALRALRRIPGTTPATVLDWARLLLRGKVDLPRLARMARREPPRVRALLGALLEDSGARGTAAIREELRRSLNPLTTYRIPGVVGHLRSARAWSIR